MTDHRPFERGEIVKPNAEVIAMTGYSDSSRLTVRLCNSHRWCAGCRAKSRAVITAERAAAGWPASRRAESARDNIIEPGALYAAGSEQTSALCLDCVEHADTNRRHE